MALYRWMKKFKPKIIKNIQEGKGPGKTVLLLTTIGRKSGLERVTPLQYEEIDGLYYLGSARGKQADWYRNIMATPRVKVWVNDKTFSGTAEAVSDPAQIADFFEKRYQRRRFFMGVVMRLEGLPIMFNRSDMERYAARKTMVIIHPD